VQEREKERERGRERERERERERKKEREREREKEDSLPPPPASKHLYNTPELIILTLSMRGSLMDIPHAPAFLSSDQ
jgi:hypothetical protein